MELTKLGPYFFAERLSRDDEHGCPGECLVRPQSIEEPDSVHERHLEIENDRVGMMGQGLAERHVRAVCDVDVVAGVLERQGKRLGKNDVIIDDKDRGQMVSPPIRRLERS